MITFSIKMPGSFTFSFILVMNFFTVDNFLWKTFFTKYAGLICFFNDFVVVKCFHNGYDQNYNKSGCSVKALLMINKII